MVTYGVVLGLLKVCRMQPFMLFARMSCIDCIPTLSIIALYLKDICTCHIKAMCIYSYAGHCSLSNCQLVLDRLELLGICSSEQDFRHAHHMHCLGHNVQE